jgi:hypothetical protein
MTVERPVTEVVERKAPRGESCCGRNCARRDDATHVRPGGFVGVDCERRLSGDHALGNTQRGRLRFGDHRRTAALTA